MNHQHPGKNSPGLGGCALALLSAAQLLSGCDYARMTTDEAVNTYQTPMPSMPAHTVPTENGIEGLRTAAPASLVNPLPQDEQSIGQGRLAYGYYCIHCHGPKADGRATVGQSFSPLPGDLKAPAIQSQADGEIYTKISLGFKRHPPLADTVSEQDRWAVINFLRLLASGPHQR